ncbi:glycosyltransferase [Flavihumibacter sp. R14]|nr:glycosyltransferase [Flavihumibacter soli]
MLKIFYEEPDSDRWIKYDRYPRKLIRRLVRGPEPVGGVKRWFLNLIHGLDILGYPYTINDYRSLRNVSDEWALVVGKPHVIEKIPDYIKIIYGPGIASHPFDSVFFTHKTNIEHILISCSWFKEMYDRDLPHYIPTSIWPSGIDTDLWKPREHKTFKNTVLVYDKIRWERDEYNTELVEPIQKLLLKRGIHIEYIKYGSYKEEDFRNLLSKVDAMIFLCEHETQGFAYLQTLACDIPIMAWDRRGPWKDPTLYPDKVIFEPVTSVPYWDDRCGQKFENLTDFTKEFDLFWKRILNKTFSPRSYIMENFTLEKRSQEYIDIIKNIVNDHNPTPADIRHI